MLTNGVWWGLHARVLPMLLIVLLPVVAGCERPLGGGHYNVSLVRLLANPGEFDSKRVLTSGYLLFGVNGPSLFLTVGDAAHGVIANGVAVEFSESLQGDTNLRARVDGRYVAVTGLFEVLGTGDAILKDVDDIMIYSRKDETN